MSKSSSTEPNTRATESISEKDVKHENAKKSTSKNILSNYDEIFLKFLFINTHRNCNFCNRFYLKMIGFYEAQLMIDYNN